MTDRRVDDDFPRLPEDLPEITDAATRRALGGLVERAEGLITDELAAASPTLRTYRTFIQATRWRIREYDRKHGGEQ